MFAWLRRVFRQSDANERQQLFETVDTLNANARGGRPVATKASLGRLKLPSRTLALADPPNVPGLEIPNLPAGEVEIVASLWRYPSGAETVTALRLVLGDAPRGVTTRNVGQVGIDSAKLVVADRADVEQHWTETGKDRIGVILPTPDDDTVLQLLTEQFKLKTVRVHSFRAEVVGPVSEQLAAEIEGYLKAIPAYADYPFLHFHVQTNNSFDRANYMSRAWEFMPIGNSSEPLMFVCGTGRGDGCYEVKGEFAGDVLQALTVNFIDD